MELTWEQWNQMRKNLRRYLGATGWILLVYYLLMNVAVIGWAVFETLFSVAGSIMQGDVEAVEEAALRAAESGWGYCVAVAIGLLILLLWKKPGYFRYEIWAKGKTMKAGAFLGITCVFLSGQMISQISIVVMELILNGFGYSIMEGVNVLSVDSSNFSMFLYACILAPITEEILFRGLIQRRLLPYGKRFAIFCSALTFGLFHGNLIQTPFAFAVGLVLGYVAAEYSVGWAVVLHLINNLLLGDTLNRLTANLPEETAGLIVWAVLLVFAVAATVILIVKRQNVREWFRHERMDRMCLKCFFSSGGMITFTALMVIMMVVTMFALVSPL